jgi:DnaJ-class molecular chaperone
MTREEYTKTCPRCRGNGYDPETDLTCRQCNGSGTIEDGADES